ncbi:hypothetical protein [Streptomyces kebangsaanensis]|uniref:hypothetical protein n=1 Tax=Streptomyces kebangsaanensis TaxID=864058 RepID=UPI00093B7418|nr:hypothetical protein [Streptomyces kebangsaanensis]
MGAAVHGGTPAAWARPALLALLGSVLLLLVTAGPKSLLRVLVAVAGAALTATGLWWALAHSGRVRITGALLAVLVPVAVLVLFATHRMLWSACLSLGLWGAWHWRPPGSR